MAGGKCGTHIPWPLPGEPPSVWPLLGNVPLQKPSSKTASPQSADLLSASVTSAGFNDVNQLLLLLTWKTQRGGSWESELDAAPPASFSRGTYYSPGTCSCVEPLKVWGLYRCLHDYERTCRELSLLAWSHERERALLHIRIQKNPSKAGCVWRMAFLSALRTLLSMSTGFHRRFLHFSKSNHTSGRGKCSSDAVSITWTRDRLTLVSSRWDKCRVSLSYWEKLTNRFIVNRFQRAS